VQQVLTQQLGESTFLSQAHHNCIMTKQPSFFSISGWHNNLLDAAGSNLKSPTQLSMVVTYRAADKTMAPGSRSANLGEVVL
jgi:hypothetical protein